MLMLCPICAEDFFSPLSVCPGCGCNLVPERLRETEAESKIKRVEYVELCRPHLPPLAMLIKEMLEQNGVDCIVQGGHSLSVLPQLAFGGQMRVLVDSEKIDYACQLYRAYFESDDFGQ
jgi:hypothetical protein